MHKFAGIAALNGNSFGSDDEDRLLRALGARPSLHTRCSRGAGALLAESMPRGSSPTAPALIASANGSLSIATSRLDNRDDVATALEIPPSQLRNTSDAALLSGMFERFGNRGIARCLGAFAFVYWDSDQRRLTLARDCMGLRTLFFHKADGLVVFANTLPGLLALPWVPRKLDELYLANFLALATRILPSQTFYQSVERVPSRTMVTIDARAIRRQHYWNPCFDDTRFAREGEYIERARELFDCAVTRATSGVGRLAIATSGGLDSSAVAATAARLGRADPIDCYTVLPPADYDVPVRPGHYPDDRPMVHALGRMYPNLKLHFLQPAQTEDFDFDEVRHFARVAQPSFGPTNQAWYSALERAAIEDGHRVLLTGVFGNAGVTWEGKFALSSLLKEGDWARLARETKARASESGQSLLWTMYADVMKPLAPASLHRILHRLRGRDPDSVRRYGALNPVYIADHQLAPSWRDTGADPWFAFLAKDYRQWRTYNIFDRNQPSRDYMAMYEESCGLQMRDPNADRELLEFCLSVPEWMYRAKGVPRAFARNVFSDRLPPEILRERRRGAQGGAWFRRLSKYRIEQEIERTEASATAQRLLDLPRLKQLVQNWPENEQEAESKDWEYRYALTRGLHVGRFIRWVEGDNG